MRRQNHGRPFRSNILPRLLVSAKKFKRFCQSLELRTVIHKRDWARKVNKGMKKWSFTGKALDILSESVNSVYFSLFSSCYVAVRSSFESLMGNSVVISFVYKLSFMATSVAQR